MDRACGPCGEFLDYVCNLAGIFMKVKRAGCTSGFIGIIQTIFLIKDPDALVQIARKDIESMIHSMLVLRLA